MRCSKIQDKLVEYAYGDLTERSARIIALHVSTCPRCRHDFQETRALLFMTSRCGDVEPPEQAYVALRSQVERSFRNRRSRISMLWRPATAYAAVAAIALFAVISGVGNRMEIVRLERMNSLLSDSLRILNTRSISTQDSAEAPDSSTSSPANPGSKIPFED